MKYFDELKRTMEWLATKPDTLFVGQTAGVPGTFMYQTLRDVPKDRALEFPVNESFQMQFSVGLSLAGFFPISVYPRQNFLLLAMGDMSNIVDKFSAMSDGKVNPKMIIRVATGPFKPVHPGHQHVGNFIDAFKASFDWIDVIEVNEPDEIFPAYKYAYERTDGRATMIIEDGNFYNEK